MGETGMGHRGARVGNGTEGGRVIGTMIIKGERRGVVGRLVDWSRMLGDMGIAMWAPAGPSVPTIQSFCVMLMAAMVRRKLITSVLLL